MSKLCSTLVIIFTVLTSCQSVKEPHDLPELNRKIKNSFPDVETITTEALKEELGAHGSNTVIVDSRSLEEHQISHLKLAIHFDPTEDDLEELSGKLSKK